MTTSPAAPPVVGREPQLRHIRAALDRAADGRAAGVVVTGEAGCGKSMLLAAVQHEIRTRRWSLLAARADWLERPIPYAALTRVIASLAGERDPKVAMTAQRLAETLDLLGGGPRSDVESSFGRICGQTTSLLRALLERRRGRADGGRSRRARR